MSEDPLDQPDDDEGMELRVPFVVCQTQGGPYDDQSFVAGFQAGSFSANMAAAMAVGADRLTRTVYTSLVPQIELIAMDRGFPYVDAETVGEGPGHDAMPEWSFVTVSMKPTEDL